MTELVGSLQTNELGLTRIGKSSKSKSMALKAKSSDTNESLDDEDSKMKSYITRQFKKFMKNSMEKALIRTVANPVLLSLRAKTKGRTMLGMVVSTLLPQNQNASGVKALGI